MSGHRRAGGVGLARLCGMLASTTLGAALSPAGAQGIGDPGEGRQIAEVHCSMCHAVGLEGASPMADAPPLRDLELRYPIETLAEALAEGIVTSHPQMPVFTFSTEQIDDLLTYLDSLR